MTCREDKKPIIKHVVAIKPTTRTEKGGGVLGGKSAKIWEIRNRICHWPTGEIRPGRQVSDSGCCLAGMIENGHTRYFRSEFGKKGAPGIGRYIRNGATREGICDTPLPPPSPTPVNKFSNFKKKIINAGGPPFTSLECGETVNKL